MDGPGSPPKFPVEKGGKMAETGQKVSGNDVYTTGWADNDCGTQYVVAVTLMFTLKKAAGNLRNHQ